MIAGYDARFGGGFISGIVAVVLGGLGLGAVLCLRFPALLTTPDARALYPLDLIRFLIHLVLVSAFGLGVLSIVLSRRTRLGLIAIGLAVGALLLGGSQVEITGRWRCSSCRSSSHSRACPRRACPVAAG